MDAHVIFDRKCNVLCVIWQPFHFIMNSCVNPGSLFVTGLILHVPGRYNFYHQGANPVVFMAFTRNISPYFFVPLLCVYEYQCHIFRQSLSLAHSEATHVSVIEH